MTDEERAKTGTDEYAAFFSEVDNSKQSAQAILYWMMKTFIDSGEVDGVYLGMYDRETNALVYFVDPQQENHFGIGEGEEVSAEEIEKFLTWDGTGMLYDVSDMEKYGWMCTAGVPVKNKSGETVAFVLVDVTIETLFTEMLDYAIRIALSLAAAIAVMIYFLTRHIRKKMILPINRIAQAAVSYTNHQQDHHASFFSDLDIHTGNEIENLSLVMADMEK